MKQKNEPIKQHYVPRVYLKNFSVNNQIYVLNKKKSNSKQKWPKLECGIMT